MAEDTTDPTDPIQLEAQRRAKEAWERYQKEKVDTKERQKIQGAELYTTLGHLGVATVEASYNGGGDNGCVEEIVYHDAAGKPMDLKVDLDKTIDDFVCSFLPDGWEINAGSHGQVIMNVVERKLGFNHCKLLEEFTEWEETWPTPTTTP